MSIKPTSFLYPFLFIHRVLNVPFFDLLIHLRGRFKISGIVKSGDRKAVFNHKVTLLQTAPRAGQENPGTLYPTKKYL